MNAKDLLRITEEREYIKKYNTNYGYLVSTDNRNLKSKIINALEEDDDLIMMECTQFNVYIFSCGVFNNYCKELVGNKLRAFIPQEFYDRSFPKQRMKVIEKFNDKNFDFKLDEGWIVNKTVEERNLNKQLEIDEFVASL